MKKLKESKPDVPLTGTVVKCSKERLIRKNYTQFYTYLRIPPILVKKSLSEKYSTFFVFYFKKTFYLCTHNWEITQFSPAKW